MKNQKKITTIAVSLALLVVTAVSLGAATYAWFTRGTTAGVAGFNFTARAAYGMQISTDAATWKTSLTSTDFINGAAGQVGSKVEVEEMDPTSTDAATITDGKLKFFSAESVEGEFNLTDDTETGNQVVFQLYFNNSGSSDLTLKLDATSKVTAGASSKGTENSTRVAFLNQGTTDLEDVTGARDLNGAGNAYVWEPNSLARSGVAQSLGAVANAKYDYKGINATGTFGVDTFGKVASGTHTTAVTTQDIELGESNEITTLTAGKITKLTVYIWLEGQDIDNDNSVSSGDVNINLDFDSAEVSNVLNPVNAITLTTAGVVGTEDTPSTGADYTAYVFEVVSGQVSYKILVASGDINEPLTLKDEAAHPITEKEYSVVICGHFGSSRLLIYYKRCNSDQRIIFKPSK